jgi:hypothetical protein
MSSYELTQQQIDDYFARGYTGIQGGIQPELLKRLQDMADRLNTKAMQAHEKNEHLHGVCVVADPVGDRVMRYDDLHGVEADTILDLLSCPAMMAIFREICGRNAVPMQIDMLYKHQHPHPVVIWHQGAPHPRNYPYLNVGVFLDDADIGDGCLRYVPDTQHEKQDIQGLSKKYGWEIPGVVEFPSKAGDINIQDMMILHGSQPKRTPGVRRTVYIEIRPVEGILESDAQSREWAESRSRFMGLVLRRADPSDWPEEWKADYPTDLASDEEEIARIMARKEPPVPAYYAAFPVETENYPVAADMKEWGVEKTD